MFYFYCVKFVGMKLSFSVCRMYSNNPSYSCCWLFVFYLLSSLLCYLGFSFYLFFFFCLISWSGNFGSPVLIYIIQLKHFLISFVTYSLVHGLFRSVLLNFQILCLWGFDILLLTSNFNYLLVNTFFYFSLLKYFET